LLPFRIVGVAVEGVLEVVRGIMMLPVRLLRPRAPPSGITIVRRR